MPEQIREGFVSVAALHLVDLGARLSKQLPGNAMSAHQCSPL
jgi:hypothetical protein